MYTLWSLLENHNLRYLNKC